MKNNAAYWVLVFIFSQKSKQNGKDIQISLEKTCVFVSFPVFFSLNFEAVSQHHFNASTIVPA